MTKAQRDIPRKKRVLEHAERIGNIRRTCRTDQQEFYQLLTYKGDVDLENKLTEWENFYNYHRPHAAFSGGTPYEALREQL